MSSVLRHASRCLENQISHARLNAFITPLTGDDWRARALEAQARIDAGSSKSPIDGCLVAVKDNIVTRDAPTTCASKMLENYTSPYAATVVERLERAGALIAGKTNLDEFGMGSHSLNSHFGRVTNWKTRSGEELSAGGSSGGSAVAVATGQSFAALGTDTGGSVRLPAAYCETVGFKPSYGRLSRWGVIAYANSLDTVGIISKEVSDARAIYDATNAHDPNDPTSLSKSTRSRITSQASTLAESRAKGKLRVGIPVEYNIDELSPEVRAAWSASLDFMKNAGHTLHPVSLPTTQQALASYYILAPAEASSNLAKFDGVRYGTRDADKADRGPEADSLMFAATRGVGFGDEVKRRILLGTFTLSAKAMDNYFIQAQKVRRLVQRDFNRVFRMGNVLVSEEENAESKQQQQVENHTEKVDILLCPTAPSLPPSFASLQQQSPIDAYVNDVFTLPASLAGLPAISVPVSCGNPQQTEKAGIQIIGQFGDDETVLDAGAFISKMEPVGCHSETKHDV